MITIDKSAFTAEELETYEALIAKATVDPEANKEEVEEEVPSAPAKKQTKKPVEKEDDDPVETKKSAPEASPELKQAMEELAALKKSFEMKDMTEVAKKYAPLGKKEDELAKTLYDMKKSNEANYNAYIAILDESLGIVEKSGIFAEVGKSASNGVSGSNAGAKAEAKAREIQKSDSSISWDAAIAKAWEDPQLMAEYDAEYNGR